MITLQEGFTYKRLIVRLVTFATQNAPAFYMSCFLVICHHPKVQLPRAYPACVAAGCQASQSEAQGQSSGSPLFSLVLDLTLCKYAA